MNTQTLAFEVAAESFQQDVIDKSRQAPVVLLFWAAQVPESTQEKDTLSALVEQYTGKFYLGLVDVAQDQSLAQHLQIQGLPSLRVVNDGQIVDQIDGPQEESALREMLDTLTASSTDKFASQLESLVECENFDGALSLVQQALQAEPNSNEFKMEEADLMVRLGRLEEAKSVLGNISEDLPGRKRPAERLTLAVEARELPALEQLRSQLEEDADNLALRYQCAIQLVMAYQYEAALEMCLSILQANRQFEEEIGRKTMIRIFHLLAPGDPLLGQYRRRMFAFLH